MRDFRKLGVWRKSHQLTLQIYRMTASFPTEERYGLTSQMRRAAASIPSNISEGCGHSSQHQFARFLQLAAASTSELEYQLILAQDLGYIDPLISRETSGKAKEVKKMLFALIRRVRSQFGSE